MASECTRSTLSCARCRKRKAKCDRQLPACSNCVAAKVTCTGFSSSAGEVEVPRSIVQHLESEIARLETELAENGQLDALNASDILLNMPTGSKSEPIIEDFSQPTGGVVRGDVSTPAVGNAFRSETIPAIPPRNNGNLRETVINLPELKAMISATLPSGSGLTHLVSRVRMGLTPSSTNTATAAPQARKSSIDPRLCETHVDAKLLYSLPSHVMHSLVKKYVHRVLPLYPFIDEKTIWQLLSEVMRTVQTCPRDSSPAQLGGVTPSFAFLIVYLIMAISVTLGSSKTGQEARCLAFSVSLFEEGIQHLSSQAQGMTDLGEIQVNLLLVLYASINPRAANVWILGGAAMRSCLELGLHRETPASFSDKNVADLRRRIFWAAYCLDRSICSTLQRPLSIPDAAINTSFPEKTDPTTNMSRYPFLQLIRYHQIQSIIVQVHYQGAPLTAPATSWDEWLSLMERRVRSWYEAYREHTGPNPNELVEFALAQALTILHRPSPRMPRPSTRSCLVAFEAACQAAKASRQVVLHAVFRRPWLGMHANLETGVVVLYCLRHAADAIADKFSAEQIFDMTKVFTGNLLTLAGQGWPQATTYAGIYERLLGPLLESVFSRPQGQPAIKPPSLTETRDWAVSPNPEMPFNRTPINLPELPPIPHFGPAQDAELARLLYPDQAHLDKLRFGSRGDTPVALTMPFDYSVFGGSDDSDGPFWLGMVENAAGQGLDEHAVRGARNDMSAGWDLLDHALEATGDFGLVF